jgi:hypothetical protein
VGVNTITPTPPTQVAIKCWADVVEFVKQSNELILEFLIEKTGQAKGDQVKHIVVIDQVALNLVENAPARTMKLALTKP